MNFFRSLCHTIVTVDIKIYLNYLKAVIPVIIFSIIGKVCRILPEFYTCILQEKFLLRVCKRNEFYPTILLFSFFHLRPSKSLPTPRYILEMLREYKNES